MTGFKTFVAGNVLTAAEMNGFLMQQAVTIFADATARDAAITSPIEGQFAFLNDVDTLTRHDGTNWIDFATITATDTAVGNTASAGGTNSTAVGIAANASATSSTALGDTAAATNTGASSIGLDSTASGDSATAIGRDTVASNTNSIAVGRLASSSAISSLAFGSGAAASTESSTAVGRLSVASTGTSATSLGHSASATAASATAIGHNASSTVASTGVLGVATAAAGTKFWSIPGDLDVGGIFTASTFHEEGTWTPTLQFGGATTGITYATQTGRFQRLENLVFWQFVFSLTSKGTATGNADVAGLPFTSSASNPRHATAIADTDNIDIDLTSIINLSAIVLLNDNVVSLRTNRDNNIVGALTDAEFANTSRVMAQGSFVID